MSTHMTKTWFEDGEFIEQVIPESEIYKQEQKPVAWLEPESEIYKQEQKPVAWLEPEWGEKICPEVGYEVTMTDDHPKDLCWIPLYPKRQWVGLTDEEISEVLGSDIHAEQSGELRFIRAIEAKLQEKNL